ncbi:MAG: glycerol-3-phosphate dehydrogenase/oxidase, partial [Balneolales bacterium]
VLLNYMKVTGLLKSRNMIRGVNAKDMLTGDEYEIKGRVVINATGVFADKMLKMDDPNARSIVAPSQGIHIIIDKKFLPGDTAVMVPHTDDGRVLFAIPWYGKVLLGTTDTPVDEPELEPVPREEEINFVLEHASKYLEGNPSRRDVRSVFAGLRPLVKTGDSDITSALSRDHAVMVQPSGLVTITGGKWTTYRKMAEEVVDQASIIAGFMPGECRTKDLRIHGWLKNVDESAPLCYYGSDKVALEKLIRENPELGKPLHKKSFYLKAEVVWAVRNEMAMTVEDVLSRRTRALLLNAKASIEMAPEVARLMAIEAGHDIKWQKSQVSAYTERARSYML